MVYLLVRRLCIPNMDIETKILGLLKKEREGITISEIADKLGTHRHTITKYIYRLEGMAKIKIRKIGIAKLCCLSNHKKNGTANMTFILLSAAIYSIIFLLFANQVGASFFSESGYSLYTELGIGGKNFDEGYNLTVMIRKGPAGIYSDSGYSLYIIGPQYIDTTNPQYSQDSTNTTNAGEDVLFSLYWTDNTGLAGYIFSFDNGTGTFANDSYVAMTGAGNWSNVTKTINSTVGATIQWRVYANDTSSNMNASEIFSFNTTNIYCYDPKTGECGSDTCLFSMHNVTNAHAETCSESNYLYDVCCYSSAANLSVSVQDGSCSQDGVISLSNTTNAHVEEYPSSNYDNDICLSSDWGTTKCIYSDNSCSSGYECVISISNSTNAHVSQCYGSGSYTKKVCCRIWPPLSISFVTLTTETGNYSQNYIEANATAAGDNFDTAIIYLYNSTGLYQSNQTTNTNLFINFTSLPDGTYYLNATANDTGGNINTAETKTITLDTVNPTISYEDPTPGNNTRQIDNEVTINISYSDNNLNTCILEWNGTNETFTNSSSTNFWETKNTTDGQTYIFRAFCNDSAGNTNQTLLRTFTENTKPNTTLTIAPFSPSTTDDLVCNNGTLNDAEGDAVTIQTYDWHNGTAWLGINSKTLGSGNTTKGQTWNCSAVLNDTYEIDTMYSTSVTIQTTEPTVTLNNPLTNWVVNSDPYFKCSATSDINLQNISLYTNKTTWSIYSTNSSLSGTSATVYFNTSGFSEGTYKWSCKACDIQGACAFATENRTFTVDTTNPTISYEDPTPINNANRSEDWAYINVSTSDTHNTSAFLDWNRSLVGYWSFDSYNSTHIYDNSTYTNDGEIHGSRTVEGKFGKGMEFDGVNDYVDCGNDESLNITDAITIEAWVKTSDITQNEYFISKDDGGVSRAYSLKTESGKVRFLLWNSTGTLVSIYSNANNISNNSWFHIAVVRDTASTMSMYINNVLQTDTNTISDIKSVATDFYIGKMDTYHFNGSIDSVRIYNRALSAEEINASYNANIHCYDNETEILTNEGWKYFKDVTFDDEVITLNSTTGQTEYHNPVEIQNYAYNGEMYNIETNNGNLVVSPEHKVYGKLVYKDSISLVMMNKFVKNNYISSDFKEQNKGTYVSSFAFTQVAPEVFVVVDRNFVTISNLVNFLLNSPEHGQISSLEFFKSLSEFIRSEYFKIHNSSHHLLNSSRVIGFILPDFKSLKVLSQDSSISLTKDSLTSLLSSGEIPDISAIFLSNSTSSISSILSEKDLAAILDQSTHPNLSIFFSNLSGTLTFNSTSFINNNNTYLNKQKTANLDNFSLMKISEIYDKLQDNQSLIFLDENLNPVTVETVEKKPYSGRIYDVTVPNHIILVKRGNLITWSGNSLYHNFTSLSDGIYNYTAHVVDEAGNTNQTEERQLIIDATYPTISFDSGTEENNTYFNRNWIYANWTYTESNLKNITAEIFNSTGDSINQTTFTSPTYEINWTLTDLNEKYYYNVSICDNANNCNYTETRVLTLDNTNPSVQINSPTSDSHLNSKTITINLTATDTNLNYTNISIINSTGNLVNSTTNSTNGTYTVILSVSTDGVYNITATAYDNATNSNTTTVTNITIDTTYSQIYYNPTTTSVGNHSQNWIFTNITASDLNKHTVLFEWNGTNETFTNQSGDIYWENKTSLSDGTYTIKAYINDTAGNANSTTLRTITLDTVPPSISYEDPTPGNNTRQTSNKVTINISYSDNNFNTCVLEWNGTNETFTNSSSTNFWETKNTTDGATYTFRAFCNDSAGNTNQTLLRTFTENTKPNTTLTISPSSPNTTDDLVCNNGTLNDAEGDPVTIQTYDWHNGTAWTGINSKTLGSGNTTKGQTWNCSAVLNDTYETDTMYSASVIIQTTYPTVNLTNPPINWVVNSDPYFKCLATSDVNLANVSLYTNQSGWNIYSTNSSLSGASATVYFNTSGFSEGNYKWSCKACDTEGACSFATENRTFTVDTTNPTISYKDPTPINNANRSQDWSYINVSTSDTHNTSAFLDWNRSLVSYWSFDSYNSTHIYDNSTYTNDGEIHGSRTVEGKFGKGMEFDGSNDYVDCGDSPELRFGTGDFAVEVWLKKGTQTGTYDAVIAKGSTGANAWLLYFVSSTQLRFYSGSGIDSTYITGAADGNWHHTVFTRSGDDGYFYIDGVEKSHITGIDNVDLSTTTKVSIGAAEQGTVRYFNGTIDEVRIHNRALTPEEINASYNNGLYRLETNLTSLSDGVYNYTAYVVDEAGNTNQTEERTLTIDTTNPSIYYNPTTTSAGNHSQNWIFINITASDTNKDTVIFEWNGTNETFTNQSGDIYWENKTSLPEGTYTIKVYINDTAGNTNSTTLRTITLDTTPPTPNPATIQSNTSNTTNVTIISTTASDGSGVGGIQYYFNATNGGNSSGWQSSSNFTDTGLTPNTQYRYTVQYRDSLNNTGNTSSQSCIYTKAEKPSISSVDCGGTQASGYYCNTTFSMGNNPAGTEHYINETTDNTGATDQNWTTSTSVYQDTGLAVRTEYCYQIKARNNETIETSYTSETCDTVPNNPPDKPVLNSPDNNSYINTNYTLLNWTCSDPDGDAMTVYIYGDNTTNPTTLINTTTNCQSGTSYTFNWTNLNETTYYWKVTCNDSYLENTSDIYQFTIDTANILINFTDPTTQTGNHSQNYIEANVTATDDNLENVTIYLYNLTGLVYNFTNSTGFFYNFTNLDDGTYYLNATANDTAGNTNSTETRTITLDTVPPTEPTLISPPNNTNTTDNTPDLNWTTVTETNFANYTVQVDNDPAFTSVNYLYNTTTIAESNYSVTSAWSDNIWYWRVIAYDNAGNSNTSGYYIYIVDTTPPVITLDSPPNGSFMHNGTWINLTISDAINTVSSAWWSNNSGATNYTDFAGTYDINTTGWSEGAKIIYVWSNDTLNNLRHETYKITIDDTSPTISYELPTKPNNTYISYDSTCINTTIIDYISPDNITSLIDWNRSLVGWWRFNEETGENNTFFRDWSTWGNNGTNGSNPTYVTGKFGKALQFDGVDDYIDTGVSWNTLLNGGTYDFTIEAWIKYLPQDSYRGIVGTYADSTTSGLWIDNCGGLRMRIKGAGSPYGYTEVSGGTQHDNQWHHIAAVGDRDGLGYFYVDSILKNSADISAHNGSVGTAIIKVGKVSNAFNGSIDEVRIYNRALSPEEINASYNTALHRLYHNFTNLEDGIYIYTAYAQDLAGNTNSEETRTITIDTIFPTEPTLISPPNNTNTTDNTPDLNWTTVTETNFANYTVQVDNDPAFTSVNYLYNTTTIAESNYSVTSAWSDNIWYWRVIAYDNAGNSNTSGYYIYTVDTTPPQITIQSPENIIYNTQSIWFNITLNEAGDWCGYSLDGAPNITMTNSSGNWNAQNTSVTEGSHTIIFYCNDTFGNTGENSTDFTISLLDLYLSKSFNPDLLVAYEIEQVNTTTNLKINKSSSNILSFNLTDEVPWDFSLDNDSITVTLQDYNGDPFEKDITNNITITINDLSQENNTHIIINCSNTSVCFGNYLEVNDTIILNYLMNSSELGASENRTTYTYGNITDVNSNSKNRTINTTISVSEVVLRGYKTIDIDLANPQNLSAEIVVKAIGGTLNNIIFTDYLPEGAILYNLKVYWYNGTYQELQNNTNYNVTISSVTLSGGYLGIAYIYNFTSQAGIWPGYLQDNESLIINYSFIVLGGGQWELPAIISGYDPVYRRNIKTEMYANANVPSFDVIVEVLTKKVMPGGIVKALLKILNVGGPKAKVDVFSSYAIKTLEGEMVNEKTETIAVVEEKERLLKLNVPEGIKPGRYIFESYVTYVGREAVSTEIFEVGGEEKPGFPQQYGIYIIVGILIVLNLVALMRRK